MIAGRPFSISLFFAAGTAVSVFLTWAISRELDPPHHWSAFLGLPFTLIAALYYGLSGLILLFFILLIGRTLNGSTGLRITVFDSIILVILAALLYTDGVITAMFFLAVVFFIDSVLEPVNRKQKYFAYLTLVLFFLMVLFFNGQAIAFAGLNLYSGLFSLLLIVSTIFLALRLRDAKECGDNEDLPLNYLRICSAQVVVASFIIVELLLKGSQALLMIYPVGFAYLGTVIYHLAVLVKNK